MRQSLPFFNIPASKIIFFKKKPIDNLDLTGAIKPRVIEFFTESKGSIPPLRDCVKRLDSDLRPGRPFQPHGKKANE
jgi:hypothetical protein